MESIKKNVDELMDKYKCVAIKGRINAGHIYLYSVLFREELIK